MKKVFTLLMLAGITFPTLAQLVIDRPQLNDVVVVAGQSTPQNVKSNAEKANEKADLRFTNLNFEGRLMSDSKVKLYWIAPLGYQSASFIIQKSFNNQSFEDFAKAPAKSTAEKGVVYSFIDPNVILETTYYRIIELKNDGAMKTYPSITIAGNDASFGAIAKINYVKKEGKGAVQLSGNYDFNNADVMMVTGSSEMGIVCEFKSDKDGELTLIPAYELAAGDYVVKLREATTTRRIKFAIKDDDQTLR